MPLPFNVFLSPHDYSKFVGSHVHPMDSKVMWWDVLPDMPPVVKDVTYANEAMLTHLAESPGAAAESPGAAAEPKAMLESPKATAKPVAATESSDAFLECLQPIVMCSEPSKSIAAVNESIKIDC